jgi:hypothetical protein
MTRPTRSPLPLSFDSLFGSEFQITYGSCASQPMTGEERVLAINSDSVERVANG